MLKVGLTGGIGSGKTTVARFFQDKAYPVYIADQEAARLINTSSAICQKLTQLLGPQIYKAPHRLDKTLLADCIFKHPDLLQQVNTIVHPEVMNDFQEWCTQQNSPLLFFESAILYEAGLEHYFDCIICIYAPLLTRIQRVMKRDRLPEEKIRERINNQLDDTEKCKRADFSINTDEGQNWQQQALEIESTLIHLLTTQH